MNDIALRESLAHVDMQKSYTGLDISEALAQWGVKGMKWGVRRSEKQLAAASAARSEDSAKSKALLDQVSSSGLSSLSNAQLKSLNERISLEQNFQRLTAVPPQPTKFQKFMAFQGKVSAVLNSHAGKLVMASATKFYQQKTGDKGNQQKTGDKGNPLSKVSDLANAANSATGGKAKSAAGFAAGVASAYAAAQASKASRTANPARSNDGSLARQLGNVIELQKGDDGVYR